MANNLNFRVALKLQPSSNHHSEIKVLDKNTISFYSQNYKFNYIFDHSESSNQIYQSVLDQYLENLVNGIDSAIVVYGPASEAKAETLGLHFCSNEELNKHNTILFFLKNLFSRLDEGKVFDHTVDFSLSVAISQIHRDSENSLVRSGHRSLIKVDSLCDIIQVLDHINPHQKESHLFFKIRLEKFKSKKKIFSSEINFIDLAGWKYVPGKGDEFIRVKWDLMSLEWFLLARINQNDPYPNGHLSRCFHKILKSSPQSLLIVCLDPAQPYVDSVEFGSRFYQSLDTKFTNFDEQKKWADDETIEWYENGESFKEDIEKGRQIHVESEDIKQCQESDVSAMIIGTPLTLKRQNRLCDSLELYFRDSDKKFKQPELPHVSFNFGKISFGLEESEKGAKRRKINSDNNIEELENLFNLMIKDTDQKTHVNNK